MPTVEIADGEDLQKLRAAAGFLDQGFKHPKTREKLLRIAKELNPNAAIPELDAVEPIDERIAGLEKTLATRLDAIEAANASKEREQTVDAYIAKGHRELTALGYSSEGIAEIEKLMGDEGITNYAAGAALYDKRNPPPAPSVPDYTQSPSWNFNQPAEDNEAEKRLLKKDYKGFTASAIASVMKELRQNKA